MNVQRFHFHVYYEKEQRKEANALIDKVSRFDYVAVGRMHDKALGPHPVGSCQLTVDRNHFLELTLWLMQNRGSLSIFVHHLSGDDLIDHTDYVMWLGDSNQLNTSMFRNDSIKASSS